MSTPTIVTKEMFFSEGFNNGKSFSVIEKEWLASGHAIKRGKSAKDSIVHAYIAGEVTAANLKEWLQSNGTDNDVKQASYYANRLADFDMVAKASRKVKAA